MRHAMYTQCPNTHCAGTPRKYEYNASYRVSSFRPASSNPISLHRQPEKYAKEKVKIESGEVVIVPRL